MSVVIHNVDPSKPREIPLFEKELKQRVRRQKGSRNLLFNEEFENRKKVWNRWTGNQINLTRRALENAHTPFRKTLRRRNNMNVNNNNLNTTNLQTANLNKPEWNLAVGNNNEAVPNILKYKRTFRKNKRSNAATFV